ncbi:MAG: helix-turn-helix transcriptional regulator, partial [Rubrivivax sp.]
MSESRFDSGIASPDSVDGGRPAARNRGAAPGPAVSSSAGALLRAAREGQGLHIAALAAAIKVSPRKLDALENDRLSELPDATFSRALAQTVCRTLKIDARPVLALLPAAGATSIEPISRTAHAPFRERSGRDAPSFAN